MGKWTSDPLVLAFSLLIGVGIASASTTPQEQAGAFEQFTSRGHLLGFDDRAYHVSNGSYALNVQFEQARPVAPSSARQDGHGAARLERVCYSDLWDGISVTYDTAPGGIVRSTWILEPGADPTVIRLRYNRPVRLTASGTLSIRFDTGALSESRPLAWQDVDGARQPVEVAFAQLGDDLVGFQVGTYRPDLPLTIDPTLTWNTFFGGTGIDTATGIAVDGTGNLYVSGYGQTTWGNPLRPYTAGYDGFVAKLTANGALVWHTFLGTTDDDYARGIALDGSGDLYVTGDSHQTWGTPIRPFTIGGTTSDGFVAKLTADGEIVWSTFLGGNKDDFGNAIAVDGSGDVYVAGDSRASWDSPVRAFTAAAGDLREAFAAKLTTAGALTWHTFLGSDQTDNGNGIAVDAGGNVYVAGTSFGTWGSPLRAFTHSSSPFAAKLASDGTLTWNTFLAATLPGYGRAITTDASGSVYVTGNDFSSGGSFSVIERALTAKVTSDGALTWLNIINSNFNVVGRGVAVDGSGNVYIAGSDYSSWGTPDRAYTPGAYDAFAARLTANGAVAWNTFLGGSGDDAGFAVALDGNGNLALAGSSAASWGTPLSPFTGGKDAMVVQIAGVVPTTSTSASTTSTTTETTSTTTTTTESTTTTTESTTTTTHAPSTTTSTTETTTSTSTTTTTTSTTTASTSTTIATSTTETTTTSTTTTTFPGVGLLKCYGGTDSRARSNTYTLDLAAGVGGFPSHLGCALRLRAGQTCVEVEQQNVSPTPPGGGPTIPPNAGSVFLSYRLKCPRTLLPNAIVGDEFGPSLFRLGPPAELLAAALPGPANDYVVCYKSRDARAKASFKADLLAGVTGFADEIGCTIKARGDRLCVQVTSENVSPPTAGGPGAGPAAGGSFIGYKLKCPRVANSPLAVADQFGAGTFTPMKPKMLLVPAQ